MKRRAEQREDSGVEWFASNTLCQERENKVSFYQTAQYTTSVLCVCFVRYLVVVVVVVVVREEKKQREKERRRGSPFSVWERSSSLFETSQINNIR
jgi:hypothetical protein